MGKVNFPVIILVIALRMMNKVYLLYIILFQAISSVAIGALDSLAFKTDKKWSTIEGYQNEVLKIKFCVPNKEYWLNISSKKNRFEIINIETYLYYIGVGKVRVKEAFLKVVKEILYLLLIKTQVSISMKQMFI
jgi:hypothetical protein